MRQKIYMGTYTSNESEGIYSIELDSDSKTLENLSLVTPINNPSYLNISVDRELLITIGDDGNGQGGIASYAIDVDGKATLIDAAFENNPNPAYVSYDEAHGLAYSANYNGGYVSLYTINSDGHLTLSDRVEEDGNGPHPNQEASHAHYIKRTPDNKYVMTCNLGTDYVTTYKVKTDNTFEKVSETQLNPGSGPRHLVFHPKLSVVYVVAELTCEVHAFHYDDSDGSLSHFQTISTVKETFEDWYSASAIRTSKDGKFLYASTRGINTITTYLIDEQTGRLKATDWTNTEGQTPRDFNIDPTGQFIVCGHQDTNVITLFERDMDSGKLSVIQNKVFAPEVINIVF